MSSRSIAPGILLAVASILAASAQAAQIYQQPRINLRAETSSNRDLDPNASTRQEGYVAEFQTTMGIITPRTELTLRPYVRVQEYPDNDEASNVEGMLDLGLTHVSPRSNSYVYASFDRRDTTTSEFGDPRFNDLDPNNPTAPETGRTTVGETRTFVQVRPAYDRAFTQRIGGGIGLLYQSSTYSGAVTSSYIDYDYLRGDLSGSWKASQRTTLKFGPYVSRYEARDSDAATDGVGAALGFETRWSEIWSSDLSLNYERDTLKGVVLAPGVEDASNQWGALLSATRKGVVGDVQLSIGHLLSPSGNGGLTASDQAQVSYTRQFNARAKLVLAGRYNRDKSVFEGTTFSEEFKYGTVYTEFEWKLAPKWFISGGYEYVWQRYESQIRSADNSVVFVRFGYEGLGRRP